MTAASLTPTSYVVLGLVGVCGEATPYDLKALAAQTIGNFWSFPHSQLYSEPPRLAELGLLSEEREETGRRRRTFRLTEQGQAALQEWLAEPKGSGSELRDLGLLKLFFGSVAASPADVVSNAQAQVEVHRQRLAEYEETAASDVKDRHMRATLRLGLAYERAAVAFWTSVAEEA